LNRTSSANPQQKSTRLRKIPGRPAKSATPLVVKALSTFIETGSRALQQEPASPLGTEGSVFRRLTSVLGLGRNPGCFPALGELQELITQNIEGEAIQGAELEKMIATAERLIKQFAKSPVKPSVRREAALV